MNLEVLGVVVGPDGSMGLSRNREVVIFLPDARVGGCFILAKFTANSENSSEAADDSFISSFSVRNTRRKTEYVRFLSRTRKVFVG